MRAPEAIIAQWMALLRPLPGQAATDSHRGMEAPPPEARAESVAPQGAAGQPDQADNGRAATTAVKPTVTEVAEVTG
jgi:hypothetical protein